LSKMFHKRKTKAPEVIA